MPTSQSPSSVTRMWVDAFLGHVLERRHGQVAGRDGCDVLRGVVPDRLAAGQVAGEEVTARASTTVAAAGRS